MVKIMDEDFEEALRSAANGEGKELGQRVFSDKMARTPNDPNEKSYAKISTSTKGVFSFECKVVGEHLEKILDQTKALADSLQEYCDEKNKGEQVEETW